MVRALPARELLRAWELGLSQLPPERALTLLAAADPETSHAALAQLSIGQRDARLLALREQTFGRRVVALATCPACDHPLELDFLTSDIQAEPRAGERGDLTLEIDGYHVSFRLPDSRDLLALAQSDSGDERRQLLERCLVAVEREGQEVSSGELPASVVAAVNETMATADPQADVELALCCPGCEHNWLASFDVFAFFWDELTAWAQRLLQEVHLLASIYGWSEADILAMSALRRRLYLEMIVG